MRGDEALYQPRVWETTIDMRPHSPIRGTAHPLASTVLPRAVETQTPPRRAALKRLITRKNLVAGVGFEPTTFRL
jgi:hypothetical protein